MRSYEQFGNQSRFGVAGNPASPTTGNPNYGRTPGGPGPIGGLVSNQQGGGGYNPNQTVGYQPPSRPDIAYPGVNYAPGGVVGRPMAPPQPRPSQGPYIPPSLGQGMEYDYRSTPEQLAKMTPQERQQANRHAHNMRARDNRSDVNHRNVILNNAANDRTFANRHPIPPVPMPMPQPHPFLPPGTFIHPPQRPQMQIPPGSQVVDGQFGSVMPVGMPRRYTPQMMIPPGSQVISGGGNFTQSLMNALGGNV